MEVQRSTPSETKKSEPGERIDDPVRMYLREMGSVELLSREGEIAIAKRIEAGREAMIAGLCESPLTFQAIIIWRDELNDGKVFLRDIIDLEETYAGPHAKNVPTIPAGDGAAAPGGGAGSQPSQTAAATSAPVAPTPFRVTPEAVPGEPYPTFDNVADSYKRLRRLQDQDIENTLKNQSPSPARERKYKKLKDKIIAEVKSLRLNQARIDLLVERLYEVNRRLVGDVVDSASGHPLAGRSVVHHPRPRAHGRGDQQNRAHKQADAP
jgi:RNA polymerase primary sigma factor